MDLITLSMPVYNVEKYVEQALLSALNQTYENIEYIIVDDRGTDKSMDIVRRIISGHPRGKNVRIIAHEKNIGLGAVRNSGIENARGKYFFFMDSDDEISSDCIEKLHVKMQEHEVDFVSGSYRKRLRSGEIVEDIVYTDSGICGHLEIARQFFETRNKSLPVFLWNKLYRLSFLRNNHIVCNPNQLNEDNIFSFQVFLNAFSCSFIPDITYFYSDTPNSITKKVENPNVSVRFGVQFAEIISFYREYAQKYSHENIYEFLLIYIINKGYFFAAKIDRSNAIPKSEKKKLLKTITAFPIRLKEISRLKRKRIFLYSMYFVFKMPFKLFLFKFILWASAVKKRITGISEN
jgi:glycosyltransferase involved in cell wall biosynthesis